MRVLLFVATIGIAFTVGLLFGDLIRDVFRRLLEIDDEFGFDLDAPPPNPTFTAETEAQIYNWADYAADRSEP